MRCFILLFRNLHRKGVSIRHSLTRHVRALLFIPRSLRNTANKAPYWLDLLLIIVAALGPRFVVKFVHQHFFPSDIQIAYEAQQRGRLASLGERPMELSEVETILSNPSAPRAF